MSGGRFLQILLALLADGRDFVDASFGMHPTEDVQKDIELARIITVDHQGSQYAVLDDAGKQSTFRGYLDVSGSLDAFLLQVSIPLGVIGDDSRLVPDQNLDDCLGLLMRFPIGDSVTVDHVIHASGPKQSQLYCWFWIVAFELCDLILELLDDFTLLSDDLQQQNDELALLFLRDLRCVNCQFHRTCAQHTDSVLSRTFL